MKFEIKPENRKKQFELLMERAYKRVKSAEFLYEKEFYNDAVSRAYYAIFDAASAVLITKGLSAKTHAGVITLFNLHFVKTRKIPAKYIQSFRRAKEAREEADYEILKKFSKEETEEIIKMSKEFVNFIKEKFKKI